jgi:hypothetical protein
MISIMVTFVNGKIDCEGSASLSRGLAEICRNEGTASNSFLILSAEISFDLNTL